MIPMTKTRLAGLKGMRDLGLTWFLTWGSEKLRFVESLAIERSLPQCGTRQHTSLTALKSPGSEGAGMFS